MLEMFFDNEKIFSVFENVLQVCLDNETNDVCMPKILWELNIPASEGAEILQSFVFLGMLEEKENTLQNGVFKFNPDSEVSKALFSLDDVVAKKVFKEFENTLFNGDD